MRALALQLAGRYGDRAASVQCEAALRAAAGTGATSTFFTKLRLSHSRRQGESLPRPDVVHDDLFDAWDRVISQYGATGPRFDRWADKLVGNLRSDDHDTVARAIARVGSELLGLPTDAPRATSGEHDAHWELLGPHRILTFEVKLAPAAQRVVNDDVEQAEGAVRALENQRLRPVRGLLVTPWGDAEPTALDRLDKVRLIELVVLIEEVQQVLSFLREYRRGWIEEDSGIRSGRRRAVQDQLPDLDWMWRALVDVQAWVRREHLDRAWREAAGSLGA